MDWELIKFMYQRFSLEEMLAAMECEGDWVAALCEAGECAGEAGECGDQLVPTALRSSCPPGRA